MNPEEYSKTLAELQGEQSLHNIASQLGRERLIAFVTTHGLEDTYFLGKHLLGYNKFTAKLHGELSDFLDAPSLRKGILEPRGHYKSTAITITKNVQKALRDAEVRIGIFHEKALQAEGFLGVIQGHFTRNKLIRELYPERCPPIPVPRTWTWNKTHARLPRRGDYVEPTFFAAGQGSALQGFHFTDMTWDDLIGEEAAANPDLMEGVIDWMKKGESLSVTPHKLRLTLVGTRWAYSDIYSWAQENWPMMEWMIRSAIVSDELGNKSPLFPEEFTMEILNQLAKQDFYIFSCQYLNEPSNPVTQELKPEWLRYYHKATLEEQGTRTPYAYAQQNEVRPSDKTDGARLSQMTVCIHCDPGIGATKGRTKPRDRASRSAIMVVGLAWPRKVFILHMYYKRVSVPEYIDAVLDYCYLYERELRLVSHEAHSWTNMVRDGLIKRAQERAAELTAKTGRLHDAIVTPSRVKEYKKSGYEIKETRIRGLTEWFSRGHIFIEEGEHEFERNYRNFPMGKRAWDDLDALAQGPDYWEPFPEAPPEFESYIEDYTITAREEPDFLGELPETSGLYGT